MSYTSWEESEFGGSLGGSLDRGTLSSGISHMASNGSARTSLASFSPYTLHSNIQTPGSERQMKAHINSLPAEILYAIFKACLQDVSATRISASIPPLVLTHVCSVWRALILGMPSLWSDILVDEDNLNFKNTPALLSLWLQHSSNSPIDVWIKGEDEQLSPLVAEVLPHSGRLESLRVDGCSTRLLGEILNSDFNSLEVLFLRPSLSDLAQFNLPPFFPRLEMLSDMCSVINTRSLHNQEQLSYVSEGRTNPQEMCELLRALPNLETLRAYIIENREWERSGTSRLALPKLKTLDIGCDMDFLTGDQVDPRPILDNFTVPNLEKLSLVFLTGQQRWSALHDFLSASKSTSLQELRLSIGSSTPPDIYLPDILRIASTVAVLEFPFSVIDTELLRCLIWDENDPQRQLLPRLKTLKFLKCRGFGDSDIIPVLQSRAQTLGRVDFVDCDGLRPENEHELRATGIRNLFLTYKHDDSVHTPSE